MIRSAIRLSGADNPEILYDTETGPRAFAEDDRIVFTKNDKTLGVKNGMLGTVVKTNANQITVNLDGENGKHRKMTFHPRTYQAFDHGYAVTIHKSQSATVERSYILASKTMDAPLTYVAMTRHRDSLKLYINGQDQPTWRKARAFAVAPAPQRRNPGPKW